MKLIRPVKYSMYCLDRMEMIQVSGVRQLTVLVVAFSFPGKWLKDVSFRLEFLGNWL